MKNSLVDFIKNKMAAIKSAAMPNDEQKEEVETAIKLTESLSDNTIALKEKFQNSADFLIREIVINNVRVNFLMIEGMINLQTMSEILIEPLLNEKFEGKKGDKNDIFNFVHLNSILAADQSDVYTYEEIFKFIMSGFVVILIDGLCVGVTLGMQGFSFRAISEPSSEVNERGSREGFTEPLRINMTMVRRHVKSPNLKFELMTIGKTSKTDICLMYMTNKISPELLRNVRTRLKQIKLDMVVTSGGIQSFLEGKPWSLFSEVGTTERPDTLGAKIQEGRIAIVVDGTPYALIVPYLFSENFQSVDDYAHKAAYASFIRLIKYFSFVATILLPGLYVGIGTFHPELLPHALLFNIAAAEEITPFPLFFEALIIHLLYEIMREAGLRLPRPVGHAVSIVGALVIGDAAVTAGLIGAPMVLVVAMTAISSFVVPSLYEPVAILRFAFIIIGGTTGLYGIALGCILVLVNITSLNTFGMPYLSPIAPFTLKGMRDTFIRVDHKKMADKDIKIQNLNGVHLNKF